MSESSGAVVYSIADVWFRSAARALTVMTVRQSRLLCVAALITRWFLTY
jgi:hypothetical protein